MTTITLVKDIPNLAAIREKLDITKPIIKGWWQNTNNR